MPAKNFRCFAIFGAMRSGSNLLERYINQFDGLKCHGELFNPAFIGWSKTENYLGISKEARDGHPGGLIDAILASDTKNIPGFRIFREHDSKAIDLFLDDPRCAKIILTRNPIDSFVSLKIARKTDQWLIEEESHRKTAQIYFDMQEFETYKKIRSAYLDRLIGRLNQTGQQFFGIHYEQLGSVEKINELAKFIGAETSLGEFEQTIKRQNPGALSEKIVNYNEIRDAFGLPEMAEPVDSPRFLPEKGTDLSRAYFCNTQNLIFAPMPSGPDGSIRKWLLQVDGLAPLNDFSPAAFQDWQESHRNAVAFTVLRHPVARAYDVFMRKIFQAYGGGFAKIREALESRFNVFLPAKDADDHMLAEVGYDLSAHRAAFKQFLAFVHHNLTETNDLRTDGRWRPQSELLDAYRKHFDIGVVVKEKDLSFATTYLTNRLQLPAAAPIKAKHLKMPFQLADIYDTEIESLTRTAYHADYKRFNFMDWA